MQFTSLAGLTIGAGGPLCLVLTIGHLTYRATLRHRFDMARLRFARHVYDNSLNTDGLDGYRRLESDRSAAAQGRCPVAGDTDPDP